MITILANWDDNKNFVGWTFMCPACKTLHFIPKEYTCTESEDGKLSFSPTIYINDGGKLCHLFIKDGLITYCCDSEHEMLNMTVEIPPHLTQMAVDNAELPRP